MSEYTKEYLIPSSDVDMHRDLRVSVLFRMLQEASIRHTEELGMGRDKTLDKGLLWVLVQQYADVKRMPVYDERIVLKSRPGRTMHLLFPRYYTIESAEGERLVTAAAIWALMDINTRKLVFPEPHGIVIEGELDRAIALPSAPKRLECIEESVFTVPYSYVDINGHMNNTRYFDLADDTLPAVTAGKKLSFASIEYVSEVRLGADMTVKWGQSGNQYYLTGETDKSVFRMELRYRD